MKKASLSILTFLASLMLLVAPSYAVTLKEIKDRGKLIVGVYTDYVPFGFIDENNKNQGYDVDVAHLMGEAFGVDVELVPVGGANRIAFLQTNKIDLAIAALGITEERAKQVLFSKPYSDQVTVVYGRHDLDIKDYKDLVGLTVAVERGTTPDTALTDNMVEGTKIQRFSDGVSAVQAIASGLVDAAGLSAFTIPQLLKRDPSIGDRYEIKFELTRIPQGIAATLESQEFIAEVNAVLDTLVQNGKLNEIHKKWIGTEFGSVAAGKP